MVEDGQVRSSGTVDDHPAGRRARDFLAPHWSWPVLAGLALAAFAGTLVTGEGAQPIVGDGYYYYYYATTLIIDGDLDFTNEFLDHAETPLDEEDLPRVEATGRVYNKWSVGPALFGMPGFLAGHVITLAANRLGAGLPADGWSLLYQVPYCLAQMAWGYLGLCLTLRLAMSWFDRRSALIGITFFAVGSNLWYYLFKEPAMAHVPSFFAVTAFLSFWRLSKRTGWGYWFLLGLLGGIMTVVQNQNVLFCLVPLGDRAIDELKTTRMRIAAPDAIRAAIAFGTGGAIASLPQMIVWKITWGTFIAQPYQNETFDFLHPHLTEILFSPKHGLIAWNPVYLFALVGVLLLLRRRGGKLLAIALVMQYYLNASWWDWTFGASFGSRQFLCGGAIFALGLTALAGALSNKAARALLIAVLVACVAWNFTFILLFLARGVEPDPGPQKVVPWSEVIDSLKELPRRIADRL